MSTPILNAPTDFGQRLRQERKAFELTISDMAFVLGISASAQIQYERGERLPDGDYYGRLFGYGFDIDYIRSGHRTAAATQRQAPPKPGSEEVLPALIADLQARSAQGATKYGHALQTGNGRDAMVDAYQEVLDLAMYFKQLLLERGVS
jgi:transcriptional regulator with XRE-family HTH domain